MVKTIVRDPILLARRSLAAEREDVAIADDLMDTLKANAEHCVGMAANMIGENKCIICFSDEGKYTEMFNPVLLSAKEPYEAEEGCLSLDGVRKVRRFRSIKVRWQTRRFEVRIRTYTGFTAQIIQHEMDHCAGILI